MTSHKRPYAAMTDQEELYKPKAGPGQVIKRENVPVAGGGRKTCRRYRNIASTPLALAYHRGALMCDRERLWKKDPSKHPAPNIIAKDRFECGEKFEDWFYALHGSMSRDSTIPTISGGGMRSMTEKQQIAGQQMARMRSRMASRNFLIVENFCGFGHSMIESLRRAGVEAHPVGTSHRMREALDDLVCMLTGRTQIPILVK
jgi:hypothetical protein